MRRNKISEAIGNIDQKYVNEATAYTGEIKTAHRPIWAKRGAIAACFALIAVLGIGVFQSGLFGESDNIAALDNGDTINFVKSDSATGHLNIDIALEISTRDLTEDEIANLFGDLPVIAYAVFKAENNSVIGVEGKYGDMKLIISAPDITLNDTIVDGEDRVSEVDGVSVNAGYFINNKNVIYYATFKLGENTVYLEHAGEKDESEVVKSEISSAIQDLIENGVIEIETIIK